MTKKKAQPSKIKGFVDAVDCMELRTSIRLHANSSPTADVPATLVITEEEVFVASEVKAMMKEMDSAITITMEDGDPHGPWAKAADLIKSIAAKNGITL